MLTRWEEYVIKKVDRHGRFLCEEALSVKADFYKYAVVNEYLEILKATFKYFGISEFKKHTYQPVFSSDIDMLKKWKSFRTLINENVNAIRSFNFLKLIPNTLNYIEVKLFNRLDPFNNLEYLIKVLNKYKIEGIFYFKPLLVDCYYDQNKYDINSKEIQNSFKKILSKGYNIGLHPSYKSYLNKEVIKTEQIALENSLNFKIEHTRQHFLRLKVPETFRLLNELHLKFDSSLLYECGPGFRAGICYQYTMYDFIKRKRLNLVQIPLLFMETKYINNLKFALNRFRVIDDQVKKYNGINMILWHNSNIVSSKEKNYFSEILKLVSNRY